MIHFENIKNEVGYGGYLLHKVHWDRKERFSTIFGKYMRNVQHHHSGNAIDVFNDYPEHNQISTKSAERDGR